MNQFCAADMHCDTISELLLLKEKGQEASLRENNLQLDLLRMRQSGYLLQNFALFVEKETVEDPWEQVMRLLAVYEEELKRNQDLIAPVLCSADIERNRKAGRMSALLTVEEGAVCRGELDRLHLLYERGVRMMTLTWNYPNEIGHPNVRRALGGIDFYTPNTEEGLTDIGREFVEEMEHIGMIPDVSHLSDAGFADVLSVTRKPFVASHSNARTVCPCVRNLTDPMIRALSERGGVMGLNYCADFLAQKPAGEENPGTIADIVAHAQHIVRVGGEDCIGLGSDFDGIDPHRELPGAQYMERLWDALLKGGFSSSQVEKIFSGNVLRVYREVL